MNGEKLKELRTLKGYTQEQLADILGLNRHYIIAIEKGRRTPSLATLERIANALNCSLKDFF
jgi:transcriptional regulator with XRE-family HTH domain